MIKADGIEVALKLVDSIEFNINVPFGRTGQNVHTKVIDVIRNLPDFFTKGRISLLIKEQDVKHQFDYDSFCTQLQNGEYWM